MGLKLLSEYLDFDYDQHHVILDLAGPRQSVVDYFCTPDRLFLVSSAIDSFTFSGIHSTEDQLETNNIDYSKVFQKVLTKTNGAEISVILTWDLFNYMERDEIINVMSYLSAYCRPGAKLFAISWLTESMPSLPSDFDITDPDVLTYRLTTDESVVSPEYSAQALVDMMPSFVPSKLSVTRSGMLEVVLEFDELTAPPNPELIPSSQLSAFR